MVLPCYVDELLLMEGLKVEWRKTDSGTLVHLYQNGESRPEAQKQDYHDRAHFFTDQIQHGNFSLHLGNLTAEDEGRYTCKIYSQQDSGETVVQIKYVEHLLVSGSDESVSASVGEDVTLNCSVNSPITPEHTEEVSWKKTDKDEHILVLLYQNNKTLSDSSDERYRGRVEFFTAEIPKGNFSLRLKSVRTEDKGVYMCQVFAGGLSANATIVLETLGDYRSLLLQGSVNESVCCCALYFLRPLILLWAFPHVNEFTGNIKTWILKYSYFAEYLVLSVVVYSAFFASVWEKLLNFAEFDRAVIIFLFLIMFLCCLCKIIYHFPRVVPVYVFGSVGVVLLNSVALMTELILKTGLVKHPQNMQNIVKSIQTAIDIYNFNEDQENEAQPDSVVKTVISMI
ncbi:junctional adhesion molecule-like protein [Labeo rohita]|uniref:Junctional adhesion molecule-like protein n=1 Tax=Labeo rohita TaxID=84645 RepID=A0A498MZ24_LABRO|nr:junctional adhesion molecule-like protein [Labeo rohita]